MHEFDGRFSDLKKIFIQLQMFLPASKKQKLYVFVSYSQVLSLHHPILFFFNKSTLPVVIYSYLRFTPIFILR